MQQDENKNWDTNYEWKIVLILSLTFGLVGLDRFILPTLFPSMMGELDLGYDDLGILVGILAVAWGISAFVMGYLSDRMGRRKVLIPAVIIFSLMSALSGVAAGLVGLLFIRMLMGAAEGPVASIGGAVAFDASHPKRVGMNNGFFQCMISLFGLGLGPIIATQLLEVTSWRIVFMLVGIPGVLLAGAMFLVVREPPVQTTSTGERAKMPPLKDLFKHRNVSLSMLVLMCAMAGIFVQAAMLPNYLTDFLGLSMTEMGFVFSAVGVGGSIGQFALPTISDFVGRKPATIVSFLLAAIFLYLFAQADASNLWSLWGLLFVGAMFNFAALAIVAGPVAVEAAPVGMVATVAGLIIGAGEIFGGGIAPVIAGQMAESSGLGSTLMFAVGGQVIGLILAFFLLETAPRKTAA